MTGKKEIHEQGNTIEKKGTCFLILIKGKILYEADLVKAYQLLRIAEGDKHLTAFRTQYSMLWLFETYSGMLL